MDEIVQFDFPTDSPKIIKVIGVGGGGGNAVNHMYREGIHDVTFVLCNTDNQALAESPVPVKLQLGRPSHKDSVPETVRSVHVMLPKRASKTSNSAERWYQNGVYHCRNGWRNRNRSRSRHRPYR